MSLCLSGKKRKKPTNSYQQNVTNNPMMNQLKQRRREEEEKKKKQRMAQLGWQSFDKKTNSKNVFEKPPEEDEEEEVDDEEIPTEARMRMKNMGRATKTSSGPNSYGKTGQGFTDPKALIKRNQLLMEEKFYANDRQEIDHIRRKKIINKERFLAEKERRETGPKVQEEETNPIAVQKTKVFDYQHDREADIEYHLEQEESKEDLFPQQYTMPNAPQPIPSPTSQKRSRFSPRDTSYNTQRSYGSTSSNYSPDDRHDQKYDKYGYS